MKKLLSVLGAIGIVASSSTAVIACGNKPTNNIAKSEELTSTKELTSMILLQKSENYGNNIADILSPAGDETTSPGMLNRFAVASQYDTDPYGAKKIRIILKMNKYV